MIRSLHRPRAKPLRPVMLPLRWTERAVADLEAMADCYSSTSPAMRRAWSRGLTADSNYCGGVPNSAGLQLKSAIPQFAR